MAQVRYLEARQISYPHKRAKVAGPFEGLAEALEAKARLAPLYPGCVVKDVLENVNMKKLALLLGGPKIKEKDDTVETVKNIGEAFASQPDIAALTKAFNDAYANFDAIKEDRENRELDVRLAKREGKPQQAADMEAALEADLSARWLPAYNARKDTLNALLAALGVDPRAVRMVL